MSETVAQSRKLIGKRPFSPCSVIISLHIAPHKDSIFSLEINEVYLTLMKSKGEFTPESTETKYSCHFLRQPTQISTNPITPEDD